MAEFIEYSGRKYWLQSTGRYFQSGVKTDAERLLHRRVWSDANGPIPAAHDVHHVDGDWRNNDLANLECVPRAKHRREHMLERNAMPDGLSKTRQALDVAREAAREWHRSDEGRAWHVTQGVNSWADRPARKFVCEACEKSFESRHVAGVRFCSSACAQRVGYRRYFDDPRQCVHCGASFMANRHRTTRFCSRACSNQHRKAA